MVHVSVIDMEVRSADTDIADLKRYFPGRGIVLFSGFDFEPALFLIDCAFHITFCTFTR